MKEWDCWDLGDTKEFLWIRIHHQGRLISLEQKDYLRMVLERFNMHNVKDGVHDITHSKNPKSKFSQSRP